MVVAMMVKYLLRKLPEFESLRSKNTFFCVLVFENEQKMPELA